MWVSVDLCLIPLGSGESLAPFIAACQRVIAQKDLDYELGANGTSIEGEWEAVFACVKECHDEIHSLGVDRIFTSLRINTRIDKKQSFREKVQKVKSML